MPNRPKYLKKCVRFPNCARGNNEVKSDIDARYNCIAFAAGITTKKYWPGQSPDYYWPSNIPDAESVDSFIRLFESFGYALLPGGATPANYNYAPGLQKVALYADARGTPTHAALQIGGNKWASKLGGWFDIEHFDGAVSGGAYGKIVAFLQRKSP